MLVPLVTTPVIPAGSMAVQVKVVPGVLLLKLTNVEDVPEQMIWLDGVKITEGDGFTVMVNDFGGPSQPFNFGVTVMVAIIGVLPELRAVNAGISPTPVDAKPMVELVLVQL